MNQDKRITKYMHIILLLDTTPVSDIIYVRFCSPTMQINGLMLPGYREFKAPATLPIQLQPLLVICPRYC
jgi:hypothetical protein